MLPFVDFFNNGGPFEGAGSTGMSSVGSSFSTAEAPAPVSSYGSYYQNEGAYSPLSNKPPKKKPPMANAGKSILGPSRGAAGSMGGYQPSSSFGQSLYNQYGQGKKGFNQNQQSGASGYSYSTAYPSQVTGSAGSNHDYNYDGGFIHPWMN